MKVTPVFSKNWDAINCGIYRDEHGTPILDDAGNTQRAIRYIINEGSSRSSKTFSLIDCVDLFARANARKRITVWRDTKVDCRDTVLDDVLKRLDMTSRYEVGQTFNKTESAFTYDTSSTLEFRGADETKKVHGLTQDVAWLNEPYKINEEVFWQIAQRTADFILIDWNPKQEHFIDKLKKDPRSLVIKSTFKDNPFCPQESRNTLLSYQPVKAAAVVVDTIEEARRTGLLTEQQAREYDLILNPNGYTRRQINELIRCRENEAKRTADPWKWSVYGLGEAAERPNRIFKWKEISIEDYHKLDYAPVYGNDWGTVDPWAIVEAKYGDGRLYLRERNYDSENQLREKLNSTEKAVIDSAGTTYEEKEEAVGLVTWKFQQLGIPKNAPVISDTNRRVKGAALRKAGWQIIPAIKVQGAIKDGVDLLLNLDVYYTSDSLNLKAEQESYSRKVGTDGSVLEEPEDLYNHQIDAVRYCAMYLQSKGIIRIS